MYPRIGVRPWIIAGAALIGVAVGAALALVGTSPGPERARAASLESPAARATGTALVVGGGDRRPLVLVKGLGALRVACAGGVPSATWRSATKSATQVVGVSGEGSTPVVLALQPGQVVRPALGSRSVTTWQIGLIAEREAIVATISLTLGRQAARTCLAAAQVLVTAADHGRYTLVP